MDDQRAGRAAIFRVAFQRRPRPGAGCVVARPDMGLAVAALDVRRRHKEVDRLGKGLAASVGRERDRLEDRRPQMTRPHGKVNLPAPIRRIEDEDLCPGNFRRAAGVHPVAVPGVEAALVGDQVDDLRAANQRVGRAGFETLLPIAGRSPGDHHPKDPEEERGNAAINPGTMKARGWRRKRLEEGALARFCAPWGPNAGEKEKNALPRELKAISPRRFGAALGFDREPRHSFPSRPASDCGAKSVPKPTTTRYSSTRSNSSLSEK